MQKWRGFYDGLGNGNMTDMAAYNAFLPEGMAAVGCGDLVISPVCTCLQETFVIGRDMCIQAAQNKLNEGTSPVPSSTCKR